MKRMLGLVVVSLSIVACAVETDPRIDDVSSVAQEETQFGASTQGCSGGVWECEQTCPFSGSRNVLVQICNGVEVRTEMPCTPEGCF